MGVLHMLYPIKTDKTLDQRLSQKSKSKTVDEIIFCAN